MLFIDSLTGKVLWFKFLKNETNQDYKEGLNYLEGRGFEIQGVVTDGKRWLDRVFVKYPYQICQFHVQKGIRILLTKNPRSDAGKELYLINKIFIKDRLTEQELGNKLAEFTKTHEQFLNEKSEKDPTKFKHEKILKALRKYKNNLRFMFTYQKEGNQKQIKDNPTKQIPNTANDIDGGQFSPLKKLLGNHNGLSKEHRKTLIIQFCNSRGKNF